MNLLPASDAPACARERRWKPGPLEYAAWLTGLGVVLTLAWTTPSSVTRLDLLAYDLLMPRRTTTPDPAVVIAIDDASLGALGRWPWPRSVHARLVDQLRGAGASAVAITLMFGEGDAQDPAGDAALAEAMTRHGRVVLPLAPVARADGGMAEGPPLESLATRAARLGHVDAEIDIDGQTRRIYLHAGTGQPRHPALALAMYELFSPALPAGPPPDTGRRNPATSVAHAPRWVRDHEVLLPRSVDLPTVSYAQALNVPETLSPLRGRAVFVGITASGLGGELATPVHGTQSMMPAVTFHAHVFEALRTQSLTRPAGFVRSLAYTLVLVLLLASMPLARRRHQAWLSVALVCLPMAASAALLHATQTWYAPLSATLALAAACSLWLGLQLRNGRRQLDQMRQHSQATLQAIGDGVITVDGQATVRYANAIARRQMQDRPVVGAGLASALPLEGDGAQRLCAAVEECLRSAKEVRLHTYLRLPQAEGSSLSLRASVSPLRNPDNRVDGAVIVLGDVSEAVASANRLHHAATHDGLTQLPNRVLLQERLELALARVQRLGSTAAILFLDLDRFKRINDSLGHSQGDEVLKVIAGRLLSICRSTDFVARWGGDEFVVLMEDVSGPEAVAVAAAKLVATLGEDITTNDVRLPSSCSVGIVMAPQDGTEIEALLAKADTAMYRAKSHPDAGFHFYSAELKIWTRERLEIEVELRQGLREGQFELHYQPQYALRGGALVGFEALLRWRRTPDTLVLPDQFIGVAEETGLIVELGAWVVQQASRDVAAMLAEGQAAVPVAVNVSARQCVNRSIVGVVRDALRETRIPPGLLKLEITETTAMTDAVEVAGLLQEIRALGVRIAVDDFGTGYSSLAYLKRFPIDELKIDRSFVQDVTTDPDDAAIVRATIALAHELGILVVAEGVETDQQNLFLAQQNCDMAQGYLYGKPQPLQLRIPGL